MQRGDDRIRSMKKGTKEKGRIRYDGSCSRRAERKSGRTYGQKGEERPGEAALVTLRGEAALLLVVVMNSFGVVLMQHSGSGISAISSVPYGFSEVFPVLSLGTWTYLFQGLLVLSLFVMRRRFVPQYLLSFVVGFVFGVFSWIFMKCWVGLLPQTLPLRGAVLSGQLSVHLLRHCPVEPVQDADRSHGPVSQRGLRNTGRPVFRF